MTTAETLAPPPRVVSERPAIYYARLDGLRAFAVCAVLLQHWTPVGAQLDVGRAGVRLFFVISGFLITGILMKCRGPENHRVEALGAPLLSFYARRFLRIFPLYYTFLLVMVLLVPATRADIGWQLAYLSNFRIAQTGVFPLFVGHCWSLSVEEQFYLLWPLLILSVPRRLLTPMVVATVLFGSLARAFVVARAGPASAAVVVLPTNNLDSLGMGALLAILPPAGIAARRMIRSALWIGLPAVLVLHAPYIATLSKMFQAIAEPMADVFFSVWLVNWVRGETGSNWGHFLQWAPVRYLGSISYSIYLWHYPIGTFFDRHLPSLWPASGIVSFNLVCFTATFIVAALSWHFLEKPINGFKRFFPYQK